MIFNLKKIPQSIVKNFEISFVFLLIICTVISTTLYNNSRMQVNENYKNVINNIYFQKTINHIFNNLTPRYKSINHKISKGETFNKILNAYSIADSEITKIMRELNSDYNLSTLKTDFNIKFTIDEANNKKIISFMFPVSRTEKIQLTRNLETNLFEKKKNYNKFK